MAETVVRGAQAGRGRARRGGGRERAAPAADEAADRPCPSTGRCPSTARSRTPCAPCAASPATPSGAPARSASCPSSTTCDPTRPVPWSTASWRPTHVDDTAELVDTGVVARSEAARAAPPARPRHVTRTGRARRRPLRRGPGRRADPAARGVRHPGVARGAGLERGAGASRLRPTARVPGRAQDPRPALRLAHRPRRACGSTSRTSGRCARRTCRWWPRSTRTPPATWCCSSMATPGRRLRGRLGGGPALRPGGLLRARGRRARAARRPRLPHPAAHRRRRARPRRRTRAPRRCSTASAAPRRSTRRRSRTCSLRVGLLADDLPELADLRLEPVVVAPSGPRRARRPRRPAPRRRPAPTPTPAGSALSPASAGARVRVGLAIPVPRSSRAAVTRRRSRVTRSSRGRDPMRRMSSDADRGHLDPGGAEPAARPAARRASGSPALGGGLVLALFVVYLSPGPRHPAADRRASLLTYQALLGLLARAARRLGRRPHRPAAGARHGLPRRGRSASCRSASSRPCRRPLAVGRRSWRSATPACGRPRPRCSPRLSTPEHRQRVFGLSSCCSTSGSASAGSSAPPSSTSSRPTTFTRCTRSTPCSFLVYLAAVASLRGVQRPRGPRARRRRRPRRLPRGARRPTAAALRPRRAACC